MSQPTRINNNAFKPVNIQDVSDVMEEGRISYITKIKDNPNVHYVSEQDRKGIIFLHASHTPKLEARFESKAEEYYQIIVDKTFVNSPAFSNHQKVIIELSRKPNTFVQLCYVNDPQFIDFQYSYRKSDYTEEEGSQLNSDYYRYWRELLAFAIKEKASDIHIEAREHTKKTIVRMRINGELMQYKMPLSYDFALSMVSILYNVVGKQTQVSLDVTKFQTAIIEQELDEFPDITVKLRYQAVTVYPKPSFDIICRLLINPKKEEDEKIKPFTELGYEVSQSESIMEMISKPEGVIIIAGTTGSGKSTTLKNMIMYINASRYFKTKIYTIEDPPEYIIPSVTQIPVLRNENDVEKAHEAVSPYEEPLKAAMRSDPDTLMIGEIRDYATANGMKKGSQSGHQVLSTIHAASALGIPERLEDFEITPKNMSSPTFLNGLIYQKLLPVLCPHCKIKMLNEITKSDALPIYLETMSRLRKVVPENLNEDNVFLRNEKGCSKCKHTGVIKREVVAEIIKPSFDMLKCFGEQDYIGAYRSWRFSSDRDPLSSNMLGKTVLEHAILKIARGEVSPLDVEAIIGRLDDSLNRLIELEKREEGNQPVKKGKQKPMTTQNNSNPESDWEDM